MSNANKRLNLFFSSNTFKGSFNSFSTIPSSSNLVECSFIGRSNVGKSSIINAVTKSKNLAKTSKTPGRTQSINIFEINQSINLVDLPGYGFAKISKVMRHNIGILIEEYMKNRANLTHVFVLIDSKVGLKDLDIDMFDLLSESNKSFSIIFTKVDKCSQSHLDLLDKSILSLMKSYSKYFVKTFFTSTKKLQGIINVQKAIYQLSQTK